MQRHVYYPRWVEPPLRAPTSRGKVRLILGACQTGKSSLLRELAPPGAHVINLQDPAERNRFERTPGLLASELRVRREKRLTVCIDEIQKVPALLDEVQLLHDEAPRRYEFFVTGSSARRLRSGAANLLPGRAHAYHLFPLVLPERGGVEPPLVLPLPAGAPARASFAPAPIEDLLVWGGLPGVSSEPPSRKSATLSTYAEVYLEEEIRREALVRDLGAFSRFLELAAIESARTMNLTGLSQESGVPVATLRTYYQILVDTFVGYWLPSYGRPGRKRLLSTPRFFFFDPGVRNAAARLPLGRDLLRTEAGPLFEQWVVTELLHRAGYLGRTHRVSFWRTAGGAEVDAVLETPGEDVPIEAKWTGNPRPADARHLELFLDSYPARARRGFLVCRCPRPRLLTERVTAIPWDRL